MRLSNGQTAMRVLITPEEYEELSDEGRHTGLFVKVNERSNPENFLELTRTETPGSRRVNFVKTRKDVKIPDIMVLTTFHFAALKRLPRFAPEDAELIPDISHSEAGWTVTRPAMQRNPVSPVTNPRKKRGEKQPAAANGLSRFQQLKAAVQLINEAKAEMGDDLVIDLREGRIVLLLEVA